MKTSIRHEPQRHGHFQSSICNLRSIEHRRSKIEDVVTLCLCGLYLVFGATLTLRLEAQATQTPPSAGRADVGRTLFTKNGCYQCHGREAQGGAAGPRLGPGAIPLARLQYVRKPTGDMPPYTTKVLSDRDLADIYAFLESLPKPPAVSSIPLLRP
jgi:mono/diheme cytochrome c family protein